MKNNLPHTMMIWQGRDDKVSAKQNIIWGIEHFEDKYDMKVSAVGCHESVISEVEKEFPGIRVYAEKTAYAENQFHIYGRDIPKHKIDELN